MSKYIYISYLLTLLLNVGAQCPDGDVVFELQSEIDHFILDYPECSELNGNVLILNEVYNLSGFINIESIDGSLYIDNNDSLGSLSGLNNLESIGESLIISWNRQGFETLAGLDKLSNIGKHLYIETTSNLKSVEGLNNLTHIGGNLGISACYDLVDLEGFENLSSIGGNLQIYYNDSLKTLGGLSKVNSLEGGLFISRNISLINLQGIKNIESINGHLYIEDNMILKNLSGLKGIEPSSISKLHLIDNPQLSECNSESICEALELLPSNLVNIENNAPNCNSQVEVEAACTMVSAIDFENKQPQVYPNPTKDIFTVNVIPSTPYMLMDINGIVKDRGQIPINKVIDISYLKTGVYFIKLKTGGVSRILKL